MKVWVLIVFGFNLNHVSLSDTTFYTREACLSAASVVQNTIDKVAGTPVANMTGVKCVEDTKP